MIFLKVKHPLQTMWHEIHPRLSQHKWSSCRKRVTQWENSIWSASKLHIPRENFPSWASTLFSGPFHIPHCYDGIGTVSVADNLMSTTSTRMKDPPIFPPPVRVRLIAPINPGAGQEESPWATELSLLAKESVPQTPKFNQFFVNDLWSATTWAFWCSGEVWEELEERSIEFFVVFLTTCAGFQNVIGQCMTY